MPVRPGATPDSVERPGGVVEERLRQLVVAGDLSAQERFGKPWPSRWMQSLLAGTRLGLVVDRWGLFAAWRGSLMVTSTGSAGSLQRRAEVVRLRMA